MTSRGIDCSGLVHMSFRAVRPPGAPRRRSAGGGGREALGRRPSRRRSRHVRPAGRRRPHRVLGRRRTHPPRDRPRRGPWRRRGGGASSNCGAAGARWCGSARARFRRSRGADCNLRGRWPRSRRSRSLRVVLVAGCGGAGRRTARRRRTRRRRRPRTPPPPAPKTPVATTAREFPEFRIAMDEATDYLDPGLSDTAEGWGVMWNVYLPLLGYRHVNGEAGAKLVPYLATALPRISHDRRTYTLTLRKGLRYSDGSQSQGERLQGDDRARLPARLRRRRVLPEHRRARSSSRRARRG